MPDPNAEVVSVGQILVLRNELDAVAQDPNEPLASVRRSTLLMVLLDEILDRRQNDADTDSKRKRDVQFLEEGN